ncbi:hypothetical protein [Verrucosispora sp. WMMC514]|uniref:hypothetical protein n=1 Tax=Verrucosispora sp. WMMC514 TaxID=3015156 RepID=UPI00248AA326|nr:hypothetical protein [Verrucosispora sp. WMMC514]WBB94133.1 hypothetical protein O7597_14890 [Verrucosispora sp. WMMC514]
MTAPAPRLLGGISSEDQQRIRNAVADRGPGIFHSPMVGGSRDSVARYLAEGELGGLLADRYDWQTVKAAVAEAIDEDPTVIGRSPEQAKVDAAARTAQVDRMVGEAEQALRAGDLAQVAARLDAAWSVDPDHRIPGVGGARSLGVRLADVRDRIRARLARECPESPPAAGYELGCRLPAGRIEVRDRGAGEVVLVCHESTAVRWVGWIVGLPAGPGEWVEDNDLRVCACRHLCASHASTLADHTSPGGVGNGSCGVDGCGCGRFVLRVGKVAAG